MKTVVAATLYQFLFLSWPLASAAARTGTMVQYPGTDRVTAAIGGEHGVVYLGEVGVQIDESCAGCELSVTGPPSRVYDAESKLHAIEPSILAVPEPGALVLLAVGALTLAVGWCRRRRAE